MNRIINININAQLFHVDEPAYDRLKQYLDRLSAHFSKSDGGAEIMADIEARIAEMLIERKGKKDVILAEDVEYVIAAMGRPEDMDDAEHSTGASGGTSGAGSEGNSTYNTGRRVYRDPDDRIFGGVCSGIAAYFGLDPVWIRLAFVIAFFGFGSGFLIYLVLMIIIPEAKTPSEKLEMRGERVNISNIEKTVKDGIDSLKKKFEGLGEEAKSFRKNGQAGRLRDFIRSIFYHFGKIVHPLFRIFVFAMAAFAASIIIAILAALVISTFDLLGVTAFGSNSFITDIFNTRSQMLLGIAGLILFVAAPLAGLLFAFIRVLFRIPRIRFLSGSIGLLWMLGLFVVMYTCANIAYKFSKGGEVRFRDRLSLSSDTVNLEVNHVNFDRFKINSRHINITSDDGEGNISHSIRVDQVSLNIRKSPDSSFYLERHYRSRGRSAKEARSLASGILYGYASSANSLRLDDGFDLDQNIHWRGHEASVILYVPIGKVIFLAGNTRHILDDIDNEQDISDHDMPGHYWIMTAHGLSCMDCEYINHNRHKGRSWDSDDDNDDDDDGTTI